MYLFCWTQRKIFWRMWETEQFWGTIDFHSIVFPTMEVNGAPKQPGYKLSSKYIPLAMPIARACSYPYLNFSAMFISNKTQEQKVKSSMASFWLLSEPYIYSQTNAFTFSGFITAFKAALNEQNSTGHRVAYIIMTEKRRRRRRNDLHSS